MRATHRKVPGRPAFYGLVEDEGRVLWTCAHSHPGRGRANACARAELRTLPRTGSAALRLLRRRWTAGEVDVPTAPDGRPELSRSRIEAFLQCVQYQDEHGPDGEWGSVVHDALHAYWQLCIARGEESMLSSVDDLIREAFFRRPGADPNRYEEARQMVADFASSRLLEADRLLVVDRQPVIEFTLRADIGWAWVTGRVDRIDRTDGGDPDDPPAIVRVRDYKTGWQASGGRRLDGAPSNGSTRVVPHEFQRRTYAQLCFLDPRLNARLEAVETEIDHLRYRGEPEVIAYERGELDDWWLGVTQGLARRWLERGGPPTGGAACEYCAIRQTCGAALSQARIVPTSEGEARELAERWIRAGAVATSYRDALQTFMASRSPLVINGLEVGFLRPREPKWRATDPLAVVQHLNLLGYPGDQALVTWIPPDKVPNRAKAPLVEAGAARWEPGPPSFKARKAGSDD